MAYKTFGIASILVCAIATTIIAQQPAATKYSFVLYPKGTAARQAWVIPDRGGVDLQAMAEQHLPVNYVFDLDLVLHPPKSIEIKQLSMDEVLQYAKLRTLDLSGSKVTDAELGKLVALKDLETLVLDHTDVSGAGLAKFAQSKQLKVVSVHGVKRLEDIDDEVAVNKTKVAPDETIAIGQIELPREIPGLIWITGSGHTKIGLKQE